MCLIFLTSAANKSGSCATECRELLFLWLTTIDFMATLWSRIMEGIGTLGKIK